MMQIRHSNLSTLKQEGSELHIKVAEVIPKFTFLGKNLDEALNLQKQHEDLLLNIQVGLLDDLSGRWREGRQLG
jgi:hypothetical protein